MTTLALPRADRLTVVKAIGFAIAMALAAQVALPMPGTPVPFTLTPLVVLLAGFWLPPAAAVASMALYLAAGALGLPVWTPMGLPGAARLLGPTGGYLLAYPVAALVASLLSRRATSYLGRLIAGVAAMAVIFAGGLAQLAILTGSLTTAMVLGVTSFAALDLVKAALAAVLAPKRLSEAR